MLATNSSSCDKKALYMHFFKMVNVARAKKAKDDAIMCVAQAKKDVEDAVQNVRQSSRGAISPSEEVRILAFESMKLAEEVVVLKKQILDHTESNLAKAIVAHTASKKLRDEHLIDFYHSDVSDNGWYACN